VQQLLGEGCCAGGVWDVCCCCGDVSKVWLVDVVELACG
jgi:hypothetical protein